MRFILLFALALSACPRKSDPEPEQFRGGEWIPDTDSLDSDGTDTGTEDTGVETAYESQESDTDPMPE